jgi:hypothetical protein
LRPGSLRYHSADLSRAEALARGAEVSARRRRTTPLPASLPPSLIPGEAPIDIPRDLPLTGRLPAIPGRSINAGLWAARELSRDLGVRAKRDDLGGGSGASYPRLVRVYDDLNGLGEVRCLPVTSGDETLGDTDEDFISVKPWEGSSLELSSTDCCSGGIAAPGVTVNLPAISSGSVTVTGQGVAEDASVTVTISDGSTDLTPSVTNNGDGTFTAASQSLASLSDGDVKITATDGATSESVIIYYYSGGFPGTSPPTPDPPDLQPGSDSGASASDNRTDETEPAFDVTSTLSQSATGPYPHLAVDGERLVNADLDEDISQVNFFSGAVTQTLTIAAGSALAEGRHTVQFSLQDDHASPAYSQWSGVLRIVVDSGETGSTPVRSNRAGVLQTILVAGVPEERLVMLGACPKENTSAENTKLDA